MKRIALAVVVLGLVVAVALPPLFGARARSVVEADLAFLGEVMSPYGTFEVAFEDWDVGWFSSTATVSVAVAFEDRPDMPPTLVDLPAFSRTFPSLITLRHGPVITGPAAGLGWGSVELVFDASLIPALKQFHDATGTDHVARLAILVGFLGGGKLGLDVPEFVYEADGQQLVFRGLEGNATIDGDGEAIEFGGEFGGLTVTRSASPLAAVGRTDWSVSSRMATRYPGLWLGGGRISMEKAMFFGGEVGESFEIVDVRLQGQSGIEGNLYVATGLYEAKELQVMDAQLSQLVLDVAMGFGVEAMARLMQAGYTMDTLTPEQQLETATALLTERVTFDVNRLGFEHDGRPATASLAVEFRGDELPDGFEVGPVNDYAVLVPLLKASVDVAFHRELLNGLGVGQMDGLVGVLAREGILEESGDDYTLAVGFDNGALVVNGEPFAPFELLRLLGGF